MKKSGSVIVVLLFLFTNGGFYLYFRALQHQAQQEIKHEIKQGLKEKDLSLIVVPVNNKKDISWIRPGKEFRYQGAMYDVVKTRTAGQKKYYYCINDIKEKQLVVRFNKNHKQREKTARKLKRAQSNKYFPRKYSSQNYFSTSGFSFAVYSFHYKPNITDVSSPPPQPAFFSS